MDKDLQVGRVFFNNFVPNHYLNKILTVDESHKIETKMDNKVFKLAEKIKQNTIDLREDYKNNQQTQEYFNSALITNQITIELIEIMWDVNLQDYYLLSLLA